MSRSILLSTSFPAFIRKVLETVDPSTPYLHNWHVELMAEYLLAAQRGEIKRLIINIPPRHLKSLIVSVAWPAWLLGHNPSEKIVCASYATSLALKLSVDCRLIMESEWYQEAFPQTRLSADQNTKQKFVTTAMGFRMTTSVDSKVSTGLGGNCLPAGTMVATDQGDIPIEQLVESPGNYRVLSYNHTLDEEEYCDILAVQKQRKRGLYELSTAEGHALQSTGCHKVFIPHQGYIRVAELGGDERVLYSQRISDFSQVSLHIMCRDLYQTTIRCAQDVTAWVYRQLLYQQMFAVTSSSQELHEYLPRMWKGNQRSAPLLLFSKVQATEPRQKKEGANSQLSDMLARLHCHWSYSSLLHKSMRRCWSFRAYEGQPQCEGQEQDSAHNHSERKISQNQTIYQRARQSLRIMWEKGQVACASYRRRYYEQLARESDMFMRFLSSITSQSRIGSLSSITRISDDEHDVYDIQVAQNHNFFANGILVHNCILIDDPISAQEQYSPIVREKANIWFDQVISSRLDNPNTGIIVIIMQRLHEDDLSGYLLNKGGWTHLKLSMIAEKNEVFTIGDKSYERKMGELLHPERMGQAAVDSRKQEMGQYSFHGQYQQNPSPEGGGALRKEWLQYYENIVTSQMNIYIFVDPADSKYKRSDYTAAMVIGLGQDNNYYIVDMIRDRLDLREREDMLFDLHKKYRPMGVHYEKHSMQSDIAHMKMAMEHRNYRFQIEPVTIQLAKDDRIGRLIPLFADGRIYLPKVKYKTNYENKEVDVVEAFVHEEYLVWNAGRHDDMLDALAMMCFVNMTSPNASNVDISKLYQKVRW